MPFVAIPSTMRLAVVGVVDGQQIVNILHYKYTTTPQTSATLSVFCAAWAAAHQSQWLAVHCSGYTLTRLEATDISVASGAFFALVVPGPSNVGTASGNPFPNNVALALSWRTGNSGRTNRGRTFIGGISEASIAGDTATSGFLSALSTLAAALIAQTFTGGYDFAVASFKDHLAKIITSVVIDAIADAMRRRLPGRGI